MSSYKDYKKRALQNLEVKAEYDALQPEYDIIQAMIDARVQQNMTQKDLSAKTGITQADISRIENGTRNPSLSMVKKLAHGLGMQLKLELEKEIWLKKHDSIENVVEDIKENSATLDSALIPKRAQN